MPPMPPTLAGRPLFTHPAQVIDHISSFIDQPADLLHLALTAIVFRKVIIPHHIDFRTIRCHARSVDLWKALLACPASTLRRVHTLEVIDCKDSLVPRSMVRYKPTTSSPNAHVTNFEYEEALLLITQVVKRMDLKRFCWGSEPIKSLKFVFQAVAESSPDLQELDLIYNPRPSEDTMEDSDSDSDSDATSSTEDEDASDMNVILSPLPQFHNLTKVSLQLFDYHEEKVPYTSSIQDMLIACSNLVDVCLFLCHEDIADLLDISNVFKAAKWPRLRRLTIKGDVDVLAQEEEEEEDQSDYENGDGKSQVVRANSPPQYGSLFASFLANHPSLECFWLDLLDGHSFFIGPRTLPRLHSIKLSSDGGGTVALLKDAIPLDVAPHIQYVDASVTRRDFPFMSSMTALRVAICQMPLSVVSLFARAVPQLERFDLFLPSRETSKLHDSENLIQCILTLQHLTHFTGLPINPRDSLEAQKLFKTLFAHPTLKYVGRFEFIRDERGNILNYEDAKSRIIPAPAGLGDFFTSRYPMHE